MNTISEFLKPDINTIRKSVIDIDDSYNNDWDILAELCQNAVDAIRQSSKKTGNIEIEVDAVKESILIRDDGIGIDPDDLPILLKPFSTDKTEDEKAIGEKGVGLTFVMFSCNDFQITSGTNNGASRGIVKNAYTWKYQTDNNHLQLGHSSIESSVLGTEVILRRVVDCPIFDLTFPQLKYVLRTRTAIGSTNWTWSEDKKIRVELSFKDRDGQYHKDSIPFKYWFMTEKLGKSSVIALSDFITYAEQADRSDRDKRRKLSNKIIVESGEFVHGNSRSIRYYAAFVPQRASWDKLSLSKELVTQEQLDSEEWLDAHSFVLFGSGIFTSVKGMPTGITIEHPSTGLAGYWSNLFIIFDDKHLRFDIGRKSIHGRQAAIYKKYAKEIFNKFTRYVGKYAIGDVRETSDWDKDEVFAEIEKMLPLEIDSILMEKTPSDQEASVAAIFFECLGNGIIKNLVPLTCSYAGRYDLYARWGTKRVVIEFKAKLRNILRDFDDEQKMFDEIDCVVCWDVSEQDQKAMHSKSLELEMLEPSEFEDKSKVFPHATHRLLVGGPVKPIFIIDLKLLLTT